MPKFILFQESKVGLTFNIQEICNINRQGKKVNLNKCKK